MTEILRPTHDCPLCPRLKAYRDDNRVKYPAFFNGPVPNFGPPEARLAVIGLAPGLKGANRTGRPFTGDYAGELLYATLIKMGLATGQFLAWPDDGLTLTGVRILNAVACAPPQNKPTPEEERTCRPFLHSELGAMPNLKVAITLGDVARRNFLKALGAPASRVAAGHGSEGKVGGLTVINSYHCSRLNTNTGRLTAPMFEAIFTRALAILENQA